MGRSFESWVEVVVRMGWRLAGGLGAENFGIFSNFLYVLEMHGNDV